MLEITGNMWSLVDSYDAIVITTNGCVKTNGEAVMGRGCAPEAAKRFPELPRSLGNTITAHGNHCHRFDFATVIVTFPVKPQSMFLYSDWQVRQYVVGYKADSLSPPCSVPGWMLKAQLPLIDRSAKELVEIVDNAKWESVLMPRPGCGAGELDWPTVKSYLEPYLDSRFTVATFR